MGPILSHDITGKNLKLSRYLKHNFDIFDFEYTFLAFLFQIVFTKKTNLKTQLLSVALKEFNHPLTQFHCI
jgi:hypothetical protein